jgi:structural maintenance of chromosome 4
LWHKKKIIRANEATRMEKEREDMNAIHAEAMKEFQHDEATLKECEKNIKTLKKDHTKLEKETDDWREKYAQFERKDVKMREDLLFNKGEKKKLSKLSKKLTLISNTCVEKITQLEADAPQREQDVESAGAALKKAEAQLEAVEATLKGKTEALRTELSEVRKELKPLGKLADAAQGEMEECKSEIDLVQTRSLNARKKYEKLNQQLINAQECVEGHGEEVAKLQKEMGLKSTRVEAAKEELMAVQQEEQTVLASIENIRNSRDTIQNELATLQTTSGASKATGMLAALQSQEAGVGDDLLGRLGDLGKYH